MGLAAKGLSGIFNTIVGNSSDQGEIVSKEDAGARAGLAFFVYSFIVVFAIIAASLAGAAEFEPALIVFIVLAVGSCTCCVSMIGTDDGYQLTKYCFTPPRGSYICYRVLFPALVLYVFVVMQQYEDYYDEADDDDALHSAAIGVGWTAFSFS